MMGKPNAAVLPVPVCASAIISRVCPNNKGITSSCTGMGWSNPISCIALVISEARPS